ncbi:Tetratricopeptide-like helical [Penicillium cf. griseofulvum]|uniref:Tetratricopeptide-like helical n=1 Tax=Penicillium cf. griseofulvum TaxID=2972120 RepID=A0A9W9T665_9EURO|nr:Tetratricopeptide-like helical [Penicillium cf. griseofulvum]KAJ5421388.1 Tetratricopeptide-like helical [Penicillium cf. griseofulvum]
MPSLRNILHKRDDLGTTQTSQNESETPPAPEFKLIRSDTHTQEILTPPSHPNDQSQYPSSPTQEEPTSPRRSFQLFNRSPRPGSATSQSPPHRERRLSNLLHLGPRSRSNSRDSSANLPTDLPQIDDDRSASNQEREALWEKRATVLVQRNPQFAQSGSSLPRQGEGEASLGLGLGLEQARPRSSSQSRVGMDPNEDINIQEAIRLHESGDLERSTQMFGQLADPNGANNPLSQVLYGLALRHGWGCPVDTPRAVTYLSAAASNSAAVEAEALRAGVSKGGSAKGELVLAMFELANCFRNGWGIAKDPPAARQYYETAANLGDTDAMNEVGWCYLEGFGGKKDKFKAAKYYRLAEKNGCPTLGNSWIWKDKYNPK